MRKLLLGFILIFMLFTVSCSNNSLITTDVCIPSDTTLYYYNSQYPYNIVDTNQKQYFDNVNIIDAPQEGQAFYGQDAMYDGFQPQYKNNCDGTVSDLITNLMWTKSPDWNNDGVINADDKMTYSEALAYASEVNIGGYDDWRLPSIKELYSLIDFSGEDISGYTGEDTSGLKPFINTDVFDFGYGDLDAGERLIDAQFVSATAYVDESGLMGQMVFGVNFADGRIKGYGLKHPQDPSQEKTFYVYYTRGNLSYGINDFQNNEDGTISDNATGLMWMQQSSESTYNWEDALSYAENMSLAGYDDWRLPNAKELQSIVDYSKSPTTSNSPAIDQLFSLTQITNEANQPDYGYYWTSTTFQNTVNGDRAVYISFGRAMGYMNQVWQDVHGAGAQRSDPKIGDPNDYPNGFGPQGDAIRINNFVLLVRNIE